MTSLAASDTGWQQRSMRELMALNAHDSLQALATTERGLSTDEAEQRLRIVGPGSLTLPTRWHGLRYLMALLIRPVFLPLWLGAIIAFAIDRTRTGQVLALVAALNTLVAAVQERKRERAAAALDEDLPAYGRVLRDGFEQWLPTARIAPGDLLLLRPGDIVPADARVIDATHLRTTNPLLDSGEVVVHKIAEAVPEDEQVGGEAPNIVFAGSKIVSGHGRAVVFATGRRTAFGRIAVLTQQAQEEPSPLLLAFARLGTLVVTLGAVGALLGYTYTTQQIGLPTLLGLNVVILFLTAAVPTGLMPGITIALVEGARRLQRRNVIFRRLSTVETLGAVTVVCADQTGTITQNELTVREAWGALGELEVSGVGYRPEGAFRHHQQNVALDAQPWLSELLRAAALTTTARLLPPDTLRPTWHIIGDPLEAALVVAAAKGGINAATLRSQSHALRYLPPSDMLPLAGALVEHEGRPMVYVRGAPEEVLARCTLLATAEGERPLTPDDRQALERFVRRSRQESMRVIALARRVLTTADEAEQGLPHLAQQMTLLGALAVADPPREEVAAVMDACHTAGIRTILLTSDDLLSATSVARRCGILRSSTTNVISGPELAQLDDATLRQRLRQGDLVLARLTPDLKVRVVRALEDLGEVVLFAGGRASDVPALKAAYVGVALGKSSSPAARQAADILLLDDNIATISAMIAEGRAVEQRTRRLVMLNLATTVVKLAALLIALASGLPLLLTVGQQLAIDGLGGMLPGLGIGAGRPDPRFMRRPPRPSGRPLLSRKVYLLGYGFFGPLATLLALSVPLIYARIQRVGQGPLAVYDLLHNSLQPYMQRIATPTGVHTLITTSLYVTVSIAALLGFALVPRSLAPGDRWPRLVLFGLVALSFLLLAAIILFEPIHPYIDLISIPWWGWLAAVGATAVAALAEAIRQRLNPILPPAGEAAPGNDAPIVQRSRA